MKKMTYGIPSILAAFAAGVLLIGCAGTGTLTPVITPIPPKIEKTATSPPAAATSTLAASPTTPATRLPSPKPAAPLTAAEVAVLSHGPERQKILEEGARREGSVTLYTSSTNMEPVAKKFMERYPFIKMDVLVTRGEPLVQRTLAEAKSGRLDGDVIKTNVFVQNQLKDLMIPFNSPGARFSRVPNGADMDLTGIIFTYSPKRVAPPDVPKKVEDLLLPRWKQNIGLFAPPNDYAGRWVGALIEHLGEQPARDFLKKLGDQKPYFYTQTEVSKNGLLAGEWDVNMHGVTNATVSVRKGDPIGWVALDPTTLSPDLVGLFKLAPHPHAAMLFLDFVVAPEGQKLVSDLSGSVTQEELEKREKEGVKLPARITFQSPADVSKLPTWMKLFEELVMKK